ncbi:MAG: hypothetical protein M1818_000089 [Claussenomyces sp. TS43310]|nr:MAG: hypothetical protein M1818_000089 [Claussenomyces sp. TS43310]
MFDVPSAKRVRREDLYSPRSSPDTDVAEGDDVAAGILQAQLARLYGEVDAPWAGADASGDADAAIGNAEQGDDVDQAEKKEPEEEAEGFEFRLFSSSRPKHCETRTTPNTQDATASPEVDTEAEPPAPRIILSDNEDDDSHAAGGGFVQPGRDAGYYFAHAADGMRKWRFEAAAVSGDDVRRWLRVRYTGLEVPWRVRVLKVGGRKKGRDETGVGGDGHGDGDSARLVGRLEEDVQRRKRPGKKRRILLRTKTKAREQRKEKESAEAQAKELAEREKRTRRIREKKVKRKAKEKAKKVSAAATGVADDAAISSDEEA